MENDLPAMKRGFVAARRGAPFRQSICSFLSNEMDRPAGWAFLGRLFPESEQDKGLDHADGDRESPISSRLSDRVNVARRLVTN